MLLLAGCSTGSNASRDVPSELRNSIGMVFVRIPAGEFQMGSDRQNEDSVSNAPQHTVTISKGFYLGKFEVTQAEYAQVMGTSSSFFSKDGDGASAVQGIDTSRFPVDHVTWEEAVEFCRRLSGLPAERDAGRKYRLPTEAEWEYACRAGTTSAFSAGDTLTASAANIVAPIEDQPALDRTVAVGSYPANAWGLHDMHGNVWEWCQDGQREYSSGRVVDPRGPESVAPVVRGGAWDFPANYARSDHRQEALRGYVFFGLRVVCDEAPN
jgi:formylglycine-generating enzyme required for sulfatase activity